MEIKTEVVAEQAGLLSQSRTEVVAEQAGLLSQSRTEVVAEQAGLLSQSSSTKSQHLDEGLKGLMDLDKGDGWDKEKDKMISLWASYKHETDAVNFRQCKGSRMSSETLGPKHHVDFHILVFGSLVLDKQV